VGEAHGLEPTPVEVDAHRGLGAAELVTVLTVDVRATTADAGFLGSLLGLLLSR